MLQVSRNGNLKIPKEIPNSNIEINSKDDKIAVKKGIATANDKKYKPDEISKKVEEDDDSELQRVNKLPTNANDLTVITIAKKLGAYIITITEKSPAKYRGVFVNRMQNLSLEVIELLLRANFLRMDSDINKKERENYQKEAIIKLKMLGYISMVAENSGCILKRQFKQISIQIGETINLIVAWKKSDDERWKNK